MHAYAATAAGLLDAAGPPSQAAGPVPGLFKIASPKSDEAPPD